MRYPKLILLPAVLLVLLTGLFLRVGGPITAHATPAVSCGQWNIVSSPNPSTTSNDLRGVAAISSNDVWAVGETKNQNQVYQTLTEHWNGTQWSVVPSPILSNSSGSSLSAVTALSSNNVWAIGGYTNASNAVPETLIEHWDGTIWSIIPSPNPGYAINNLYGIAAISPADIWAVGSYSKFIDGNIFTLVEHWNGSKWRTFYAPASGLNAVTTTPGGWVWSVGYTSQNGTTSTLIEQWKGVQRGIVPSPNVPGASDNELFSDTAIADNDIWAGGNSSKGTLTEHWDGTQWSIVPSPNPSSGFLPTIFGFAATSSNNVWAIGNAYPGSGAFFEHWNGTQWSISLNPDSASTDLISITRVPGSSDFWSVGFLSGTQGSQTLTEFYC